MVKNYLHTPQDPLLGMDPIERVILIYKQVVKVGYALSPS